MNDIDNKYYDYLHDHIKNVNTGYNWIKNNCPKILNELNDYELNELDENIINHDQSKYTEAEFDPYAEYFYGDVKSKSVIDNFNFAWNHHQKINPHHWQYWILINDDDEKKLIRLDMPLVYIIEMICDWWAFSWKQNNLYEIFNWYKKHREDILISDNTRVLVDNILDTLSNTLDNIVEGELFNNE